MKPKGRIPPVAGPKRSTGLWLPPGAHKRQDTITPFPAHDVTLKDGRVLRLLDRFETGYRWLTDNGMRVIGTVDTPSSGLALVHVSVSYVDHLPSWDDMHHVRDAITDPEIDFLLPLPKQSEYVNIHPWTLHLYQFPFNKPWESY